MNIETPENLKLSFNYTEKERLSPQSTELELIAFRPRNFAGTRFLM